MAKKVVLIVLGALFLLLGVLATATGAAVLVAFGSNDTIDTGPHQVTSKTHALVSPPEVIQAESNVSSFGAPRIQVRATTSQAGGVFVGVARASDIDSYLSGVKIDQITQVSFVPYALDTRLREGHVVPASPTQQSFWVVKASGSTEANLTWRVTSGSYRLVLMRADGSSGLRVNATLGLTIPHMRSVGLGLLIGGVVLLALGALLLVLGVLAKARPSGPRRLGPTPLRA